MSKKEIANLRKKESAKLNDDLLKKQNELWDKVLMRATGKEKNVSIFGKFKRDIARIKTVIREKEIINEQKIT